MLVLPSPLASLPAQAPRTAVHSALCSRHDGIGLNASFRDPPKKIQQAVVLFFMLMSSSQSDMKIKVAPMAGFLKGLGAVR